MSRIANAVKTLPHALANVDYKKTAITATVLVGTAIITNLVAGKVLEKVDEHTDANV